jgi:hypothetical protein
MTRLSTVTSDGSAVSHRVMRSAHLGPCRPGPATRQGDNARTVCPPPAHHTLHRRGKPATGGYPRTTVSPLVGKYAGQCRVARI